MAASERPLPALREAARSLLSGVFRARIVSGRAGILDTSEGIMAVKGIRRDIGDGELLKPGEYGKYAGEWYGVPPETDLLAGLSKHEVVEHEDGTISVSPSILVHGYGPERNWHGYLKHGVWSEV